MSGFKKYWWWFLIVLVLWLIPLLIFKYAYKHQYSFEEKGQIGDSFGIITSLFSGLGFVGLLITINQQQKEIESQNRRAAEQDALFNQQRFSDTFFKLLDLHNKIIDNLKLEHTYPADNLPILHSISFYLALVAFLSILTYVFTGIYLRVRRKQIDKLGFIIITLTILITITIIVVAKFGYDEYPMEWYFSGD